MREIKFRCWNKKRKEMVYGVGLYNGGMAFEGANDNPYEFDEETLGQFTGLKDKNGKEIYEGDIVKDKKKGITYEVGFIQGIFAIPMNNGRWYPLFEFQNVISSTQIGHIKFEVIGNIYENPELI